MAYKKLMSFSEENKDIYKSLIKRSNASEYACTAIRFYERYKDVNLFETLISIGDRLDRLDKIEDRLNKIDRKLETGTFIGSLPATQSVEIPDDVALLIMDEED